MNRLTVYPEAVLPNVGTRGSSAYGRSGEFAGVEKFIERWALSVNKSGTRYNL